MQQSDFKTICRFRSTHLDSIKDVFTQIVTMCKEMDLIGVGKVSIDGTKIKANASIRQSKDQQLLIKKLIKFLTKASKLTKKKIKYTVT